MKPLYCAYANQRGTYSVARVLPLGTFTPVGDCRNFDDWEEADQVARDIAAGKYPWLADPGHYVNMR